MVERKRNQSDFELLNFFVEVDALLEVEALKLA